MELSRFFHTVLIRRNKNNWSQAVLTQHKFAFATLGLLLAVEGLARFPVAFQQGTIFFPQNCRSRDTVKSYILIIREKKIKAHFQTSTHRKILIPPKENITFASRLRSVLLSGHTAGCNQQLISAAQQLCARKTCRPSSVMVPITIRTPKRWVCIHLLCCRAQHDAAAQAS